MSVLAETAELYTPLSEALEELKRRRQDSALMQKVADFFGSSEPLPELAQTPRAVMARALFSPTLELLYFDDLRQSLPISSVFYEYTKDKFVALNFEKSCLGTMHFLNSRSDGSRTDAGISTHVLDFSSSEGKAIASLTTLWGENLVAFHHRLLQQALPDSVFDIQDFSDWFRKASAFMPEFPYLRYLGLFMVNGILFENFTFEKHQADFTQKRVFPAFRKLVEVFGVKPLIVPIEPRDHDDSHLWCYYPKVIQSYIRS